jgi:RNA 2',3'-cyclic 3'-phosphodiesterase
LANPTDPLRLFVALELPAPVREGLAGWARRELSPVAGIRLVDAPNLHVTLCFLGMRPAGEVGEIAAAVSAAASPVAALGLSVGGALWLPRRRPRVVAAAVVDDPVRDGRLSALQAALAGALIAGGFYDAEDRPFLGHVTVGRVGGRARVRPVELPPPEASPFVASAVTLLRSHLGPGGSRYEPLARVTLG